MVAAADGVSGAGAEMCADTGAGAEEVGLETKLHIQPKRLERPQSVATPASISESTRSHSSTKYLAWIADIVVVGLGGLL
jgi:hypothetical protein